MTALQKLRFFIIRPLLGLTASAGFMLLLRFIYLYIFAPIIRWQDGALEALETWLYIITRWLGPLSFVIYALLYGVLIMGIFRFVPYLWKKSAPWIASFSFGYLGLTLVDSAFLLGRPAVLIILIPPTLFICLLNSILDYHIFSSGLQSSDMTVKFPMLLNSGDGNIVQVNSFIDWLAQDNVSIYNFFDFWFYSLRASVGGLRVEGKWQIMGFFVNSFSYVFLFIVGYSVVIGGLEASIERTLEALKLKSHESLDGTSATKSFAFIFTTSLLAFGLWWIFLGSATNLAVSSRSPSPNPPTSSPTPVSSAPLVYPTFAEVPNVPELVVRYGGSTTFAPLRSPEIVAKIQQAHPRFILSYTEPTPPEKPGSGSGIRMLIEGQLSVSQSSRSVKDEEFAQARDRGFTLEQVPVAIDGIAIYVNPQVSVPSLTLAQLKDIYTGAISNWKEVGGADIPIVPVSRDPNDGGTPEFFEEKVLAKEALAPTAQPYARDTTASLRKVNSTPGAIGYATASEVCNQETVKKLSIAPDVGENAVAPCDGEQVNKSEFSNDAYPITRRLFVVIRRDGTLDEQAGVAYANLLLTDEGQQFVEQVGFVPLRVR